MLHSALRILDLPCYRTAGKCRGRERLPRLRTPWKLRSDPRSKWLPPSKFMACKIHSLCSRQMLRATQNMDKTARQQQAMSVGTSIGVARTGSEGALSEK